MDELTPQQRRDLRAKAHHLHPVVAIGQHGLTPRVLNEIDIALTAHALVKIRVHSDDREARNALLVDIAARLDAAPVQHLGKMLIVWRPRDDVDAQPAPVAAKPRAERRPTSRPAPTEAKAQPTPPAQRRRRLRTAPLGTFQERPTAPVTRGRESGPDGVRARGGVTAPPARPPGPGKPQRERHFESGNPRAKPTAAAKPPRGRSATAAKPPRDRSATGGTPPRGKKQPEAVKATRGTSAPSRKPPRSESVVGGKPPRQPSASASPAGTRRRSSPAGTRNTTPAMGVRGTPMPRRRRS